MDDPTHVRLRPCMAAVDERLQRLQLRRGLAHRGILSALSPPARAAGDRGTPRGAPGARRTSIRGGSPSCRWSAGSRPRRAPGSRWDGERSGSDGPPGRLATDRRPRSRRALPVRRPRGRGSWPRTRRGARIAWPDDTTTAIRWAWDPRAVRGYRSGAGLGDLRGRRLRGELFGVVERRQRHLAVAARESPADEPIREPRILRQCGAVEIAADDLSLHRALGLVPFVVA